MKSQRFSLISSALQNGPLTGHEIAAVTGISYRCFYGGVNYFKKMVEAQAIHVCAWERQEGKGGMPVPVFAAGAGRNVPRPKPLSKLKKEDYLRRKPTIGSLAWSTAYCSR